MNQRIKTFLKGIKEITKDFIVPITVGISAVVVAVKANKISETQALIAKNSECPVFQIVSSYLSGTDGLINQIDVTCLSGKYNNYESEIITFIALDYYEYDENKGLIFQEGAECPTVAYYSVYGRYSQMYGTIETISTYPDGYESYENMLNTISSYYDEQAASNSKVRLSYAASIHTYIKITYTNLLDEIESAYYSLYYHDSAKVTLIDNEMGEQKFIKWKNMIDNGLSVSPFLSEEELFQKLDTAKDLHEGM